MRLLTVHGKSPFEKIIRMLALALVLLVVGWAFWKNNQNMLERLNADKAYWDETGEVDPELRAYAKDFIRTMAEQFGIQARLRIRRSVPDRPDAAQQHLFLGIAPGQRAVVFVPPAEWPEAKASELRNYLEERHFARHWDANWRGGFKSALVLIWNQQRDRGASLEQALHEDAVLLDETGTLTPQDRTFVQRFAQALERDYAQQAVIRVFQGKIIIPELDNQTLFLGISPAREQAVVSFPPIMRRALGKGFDRTLVNTHFPEGFGTGDWPHGLKTALIHIWQQLAGEEFK
jgi:hypothetical protein